MVVAELMSMIAIAIMSIAQIGGPHQQCQDGTQCLARATRDLDSLSIAVLALSLFLVILPDSILRFLFFLRSLDMDTGTFRIFDHVT